MRLFAFLPALFLVAVLAQAHGGAEVTPLAPVEPGGWSQTSAR